MALLQKKKKSLETDTAVIIWPETRQRIQLRRRKLPIVRLGGGRKSPQRVNGGVFVKRMAELKLRYAKAARRTRGLCKSFMKEFLEAGGIGWEVIQQMMVALAMPGLGHSFFFHDHRASQQGYEIKM